MGLFIPTDKLPNLKLYRYSSEDHSLISKYILKRWWQGFVKLFPMSMAPNVITLLGLVFILTNLLVIFYYNPYLDEDCPRWCYFFYAFGLFMYQTFDGCDGLHARRTRQSGPLGELFDHSIDAVNTTLGSLVFASVFKMGYGGLMMLSQFASVCNFYMSTWEEYHTHTLYLSEFSGPVEGILMVMGVYIITGVLGPDVWHIKLLELNFSSLGLDDNFVIDSTVVCVIIGLVFLCFNIAGTMKNVNLYYERENKGDPIRAQDNTSDAFKGLIPFFSYYVFVALLVSVYPEMMTDHGFPMVISIGLSVAFSVGRIILAHLTLQEFPMIQIPMYVPIAQLIFSKILIDIYGFDYDTILTAISWTGMGLTLGIHSVFVWEIIYEITNYLDIYALSIKYKKA